MLQESAENRGLQTTATHGNVVLIMNNIAAFAAVGIVLLFSLLLIAASCSLPQSRTEQSSHNLVKTRLL
jgi:hypothetical protein